MARILVTGTSSGIGEAAAILLARRGHDVHGTVRSAEKADALLDRAGAARRHITPLVVQLDDPDDCRRAVDAVDVEVLVNNAAYTNLGAVEDIDDGRVRDHLEVNLIAPVRLARLALPSLRANRGRVVTVSSVLASFSLPVWAWYDATKRAIDATMESLRMEVARDGVDVVLVVPGATRTPIYRREREELAALPTTRYASSYRRWCRSTRLLEPLMSRPETVARTIVRAVEAERPRRRYFAGRGARVGTQVLPLLPGAVRDAVFRRWLAL